MLSHESRVVLLLPGLQVQRRIGWACCGWACCSQRSGFWRVVGRTWIEGPVWRVSVYNWAQAVPPAVPRVVSLEEQLCVFCKKCYVCVTSLLI